MSLIPSKLLHDFPKLHMVTTERTCEYKGRCKLFKATLLVCGQGRMQKLPSCFGQRALFRRTHIWKKCGIRHYQPLDPLGSSALRVTESQCLPPTYNCLIHSFPGPLNNAPGATEIRNCVHQAEPPELSLTDSPASSFQPKAMPTQAPCSLPPWDMALSRGMERGFTAVPVL